MPLSPPVARTPQHTRRVHFQSYRREDGLWDIEGELLDTKSIDTPLVRGNGIRKAGEPIHLMRIRATIDEQLVVQAIEAEMAAHPVDSCPAAMNSMQKMVGACMGRGWRKAIEANLGQEAGCTHMRELLQSMATAAFQSIFSAFITAPDEPPRFLGQCTGWAFGASAVAEYYPQFYQKPLAGTD